MAEGARGGHRRSPSTRLVPKERILEVYLSAIEFGERTYGCEAASRALFGVSASRLSAAQAARLAALIPGPAWYRAHPAAWERRAALIEQRIESQPLPGGTRRRLRARIAAMKKRFVGLAARGRRSRSGRADRRSACGPKPSEIRITPAKVTLLRARAHAVSQVRGPRQEGQPAARR